MNNTFSTVIIKARVTLVFNGFGDLTLTEKEIMWDKSITSYLAFGILNSATDNHLSIPLDDLIKIDTYKVYFSGGLILITKAGKQYKIAFKKKKDFTVVYEYLCNYMKNRIDV